MGFASCPVEGHQRIIRSNLILSIFTPFFPPVFSTCSISHTSEQHYRWHYPTQCCACNKHHHLTWKFTWSTLHAANTIMWRNRTSCDGHIMSDRFVITLFLSMFTCSFQARFQNSHVKIGCSGILIPQKITLHREVFLTGFLTKGNQFQVLGQYPLKALPRWVLSKRWCKPCKIYHIAAYEHTITFVDARSFKDVFDAVYCRSMGYFDKKPSNQGSATESVSIQKLQMHSVKS